MTPYQPMLIEVASEAPVRTDEARVSLAPAGAPPRQRSLPLRCSAQVTLVDINTVRAAMGLDAESVLALVDCGELRWVWDFACSHSARRRELRFLASEVCGSSPAEHAVWDEVLGVSQRERLRVAELEQRWVVSNQLLLHLARAGELEASMDGHTKWVTARSVRAFLEKRLVQ